MATLDNFHTGNQPTPLYPSLKARWAYLKEGLHNNREWDLPNQVPIAPVAGYQPDSPATAHPSRQLEERLTERSMKNYLVPTYPRTQRRWNDTVSGVQLMQQNGGQPGLLDRLMQRRARVSTLSRFQPYQR